MVGISVIHWVCDFANLTESLLSTNPTVCGAVPWAMTDSGVSLPVTNSGTILSKFLIFDTSIGCMTPAGKTFLQIQYSISAMSYDLGWVTARWDTASLSSAVI